MKGEKLEIVIIGCGNLAWHLAKKISRSKSTRLLIYNHKNNPNLKLFKKKFDCEVHSNLEDIKQTADYYFICVSDKAIKAISKGIKITNKNAVLIHTSGSQKLQLLDTKHGNRAVFYPLQTFTMGDKISWSQIPIIIEANNAKVLESVKHLAGLFSKNVISLNYQQRLKLHLAAVLANNFSNALFVEAFKLLPNSKDATNILLPLIKQSHSKLNRVLPIDAQTGPAKRGDAEVMKKHLDLIAKNSLLKQVYKNMSDLIIMQQNNKHD